MSVFSEISGPPECRATGQALALLLKAWWTMYHIIQVFPLYTLLKFLTFISKTERKMNNLYQIIKDIIAVENNVLERETFK